MARRPRRRAWGSVTTVTRDKHVIRWVESTPEGRKRKSRTIHGSYADACLALDRLHAEHADDVAGVTMAQAAARWWLPSLDALKPSTRKNYIGAWERHVRPRWGDVSIDAVRALDVQEWLDSMTRGTAQIAMSVARQIADLAVRYEGAQANKFRAAGYRMPKTGREHPRGVLTLAECDAVLADLRGARIEAPFILAAYGGCRAGESLAVMADEVELREYGGVPVAVVPIVRQMQATGCGPTDDEDLKNPQSVRACCVPGRYAHRLAEIAEERLSEGSLWLADRGDGLPMNVNMLDAEWRRRGVGVEWRGLRASWRTNAWHEWHVDFDAAELLMGHALPGVTGRHYLRPSVDMLAEELARGYAEWLNGRDLG